MAVWKPENIFLNKKVLKTCFTNHPHGAGFLVYDHEKQKMLSFTGSRLEFKYTVDNSSGQSIFKSQPIAVADQVQVMKKDPKTIQKLFEQYIYLNESDISITRQTKDFVEYDVPDKEVNDFTEYLEDNRLLYELI